MEDGTDRGCDCLHTARPVAILDSEVEQGQFSFAVGVEEVAAVSALKGLSGRFCQETSRITVPFATRVMLD
jgi:hypothetical protein